MDGGKIRHLIDALGDEDEDVGLDAIDSLAALGGPAVEPLLGVVADRREAKDNPSIFLLHRSWSEAVLVLGKIGDPRAVDPLLAAYRDMAARGWPHGWGDRNTVVAALGRIGDPRARPLLEEVATNDPVDSIRSEAAAGLRKLRPDA